MSRCDGCGADDYEDYTCVCVKCSYTVCEDCEVKESRGICPCGAMKRAEHCGLSDSDGSESAESSDDIDEYERMGRDAVRLWQACTSGEAIDLEVLVDLEELTEQCASDSDIVKWLREDPSDAFPRFHGEWGENQQFVPYIGAIWMALLLRSPDDLHEVFEDSAEVNDCAEQLIEWGTAFKDLDFDLSTCDFEKSPGLPLTDDWEDDTHDYEPQMPPVGHARDWRFFHGLGLFGSASCRAYELSKQWDKEPAQKKAKRRA